MNRTVYSCREFDTVDIPFDDIVHAGRVDVYPQAVGRGFFDIDYRAGHLVLAAKNHVGLIPLNDRVAIHVLPRFPTSNVAHILSRSDPALRFIDPFVRRYALSLGKVANPEELFGPHLLQFSDQLQRHGLLRRYCAFDTEIPTSGMLLFSPTVERYTSRGIRHRHVRRETILTEDLPENQLIKMALLKLTSYFSSKEGTASKQYAKQAKQLLVFFDRVSNLYSRTSLLERDISKFVVGLPNSFGWYVPLLWTAYLVEGARGIHVERLGAVQFDTFVVNMAEVFEGYVRTVIRENIDDIKVGGLLRDGNKTPIPLFKYGEEFVVKPDIYLLSGSATELVLDVKYKPEIKAADRYEILAFCEALQVKRAVLVYPSIDSHPRASHLGTTLGGISLYTVQVNLGADDLAKEEKAFVGRLNAVLEKN